jgi:hypothetical protein
MIVVINVIYMKPKLNCITYLKISPSYAELAEHCDVSYTQIPINSAQCAALHFVLFTRYSISREEDEMGRHVKQMKSMKNAYKTLIKNYEGKKTRIKLRRTGENYIKMDLNGIV